MNNNYLMYAMVIAVYVIAMIIGGYISPTLVPVVGTTLAPWVLPVMSGVVFVVIMYVFKAKKHVEK